MCRSNIYENNVVYNPTAVSKSPFFSVFVFLLLAVFFFILFQFLTHRHTRPRVCYCTEILFRCETAPHLNNLFMHKRTIYMVDVCLFNTVCAFFHFLFVLILVSLLICYTSQSLLQDPRVLFFTAGRKKRKFIQFIEKVCWKFCGHFVLRLECLC